MRLARRRLIRIRLEAPLVLLDLRRAALFERADEEGVGARALGEVVLEVRTIDEPRLGLRVDARGVTTQLRTAVALHLLQRRVHRQFSVSGVS